MSKSFLRCPRCRGELAETMASATCVACESDYPKCEGYLNFLIDEGFEDEPDARVHEAEERSGRHLCDNYIVPLLKRLYGAEPPGPSFRALSLGCGVGADVEALTDRGYSAYGIDAGERRRAWTKRKEPKRLFLSNAKRLPFKDEAFDFIVVGCLVPHIGVEGDTYVVQSDYRAQRDQAFEEAVRVLKPGGRILMSSPNRLCPLDLFHRPSHWHHFPRFHSPLETFLLSYRDYEAALVDRFGCSRMETLPLEGYWGFYRAQEYWIGRLLRLPAVALFRLLSWEPARALRRSFINPWLIVLAEK